jgi:energy-coupling factor transporter ATP-binding protein EcfA2
MTSPDPTATQRALAERLRAALPPEQQHRADELAAFIAALPPDRADATLRAAFPDLAPLLTPLISVGANAQIGEIHTGDIVGGSKYDITLAPDDLSVEAQRRRSQILAIVGVRVQQGINDALAAAAQLELGLTTRPDAVPLAPGLRLQQRAGAQALPAGTTVAQMFDQAGGRLLILGAPGGGKSTLLLQLAAVLLDRARHDPAQPVPALLNLSSWAAEGKPLAAWLVTALGDTYRIPQKIATELVQRGRLALLLDGLDEVDPARRDACVQAINAYQDEHLTPLAVCSRTEEYGRLAGQLELEAAIELRPLADDQVAAALVAGGDRLAGLRAAWEHDADLRDLLRTPLLLNVATLAYSEAAPIDTDEPWSRRLFPAFVERALRRRGDAQRYDHAQTLRWLRWLAQTLEAQQLSELYLERMQPGWLPEAQHGSFDRLAGLSRGVTIGLAVGCVVAAVTPILAVIAVPALSRELAASTWWLIMAGIVLGFTLLMSLVALRAARRGPVEGIQPIDMLVIDDRARRRAWLAGGAAAIVGVGLFSVTEGFPGGIVSGLALGVLMLTLVLAQSIAGRDEDDALRTRPNQGIAASLRNAALLSLGVGIPGMIGMGSLITLILGSFLGFLPGLLFGLGIALFMWSFFGGESYTKHFLLRALLARAGHAPLRYVAFLDYSVALLLLRRVGGGYAFQHRLLRDYLGALSDTAIADLAMRARS